MVVSELKAVLSEKEMTAEHLSALTGVSQKTISSLCVGGIKSVSLDALEKICTALDCQPCNILKII